MSSNLQTGIDLVSKAAEHDANKRYKEALCLYEFSLDYFQKALDGERDDRTRGIIVQKMKEYTTRAQQIGGSVNGPSYQVKSYPALKYSVEVSSSSLPTTSNPSTPTSTLPSKPEPVIIKPAPTSFLSTSQTIVNAPPAIDWVSMQKAEKAKWAAFEARDTKGEVLIGELDKAMKTIEEAEEQDSAGNYAEALKIYQDALEMFVKASQSVSTPDIKKSLMEQLEQYITRAEQIKSFLQEVERVKSKPKLNTLKAARAEVSTGAAKFVENGIDAAEQALEADECGHIDVAIEKYEIVLGNFSQALKIETNQAVKSMIMDKMMKYQTRMEQLRQFKLSGAIVSTPIPTANKTGEKYKAPPTKKEKGSLFGKKDKKTWDKF